MTVSLIIPVIILIIVVSGFISRVPVFTAFTNGAKDGLITMYSIAPSLVGLITAIGMLRASGAIDAFTSIISPLTELLHIPSEVTPLFLLKPVSGSGSLAMLEHIIKETGADSPAARIAAVMTGSTETTFYCIAVYYGSVKIKKTGCTVPCALIGDFVSMAAACLFCR